MSPMLTSFWWANARRPNTLWTRCTDQKAQKPHATKCGNSTIDKNYPQILRLPLEHEQNSLLTGAKVHYLFAHTMWTSNKQSKWENCEISAFKMYNKFSLTSLCKSWEILLPLLQNCFVDGFQRTMSWFEAMNSTTGITCSRRDNIL